MKKVCLALCLCALLLLSASAMAVTAQYRSTQNYMDYLDSQGIKYSYMGVQSSTNDERVRVSYSGDYMDSIVINCFFDEDGDDCTMVFWNMIDYNAADESAVRAVCDALNKKWRFVRFFTDDSDNSVTVQMDVIFGSVSDAGPIGRIALRKIVNISDEAYPDLKAYAK